MSADVPHAGIARVFDCGTANERPFLVMEYLEGGSLRSLIRDPAEIPRSEVIRIIRSVGGALSAIHDAGIVHKDVTPDNILFDGSGGVYLGDFGLATKASDGDAEPKDTIRAGTEDYSAPEQRHGLKVDEKADQYSLAVIAYELITGRRPPSNTPPPSSFVPALTEELDEILVRALSVRPDDRFDSVSEFTNRLENTLDDRPGSAVRNNTAVNDLPSQKTRPFRVRYLLPVALLTSFLLGRSTVSVVGPGSENPAVLQAAAEAADNAESISMTGVLAYRTIGEELQVLLVTARRNTHWTIPKAKQTLEVSVREVVDGEALEEAGVRGQMMQSSPGSYQYSRNRKVHRVTVYPLQVTQEQDEWPEDFRERKWCSVKTASDLVSADGLRKILQNIIREPALLQTKPRNLPAGTKL